MMIAALYVQSDGCYSMLPNVDPWDKKRDARRYSGPFPALTTRAMWLIIVRWGALERSTHLHTGSG
jgi:hypothetical protein